MFTLPVLIIVATTVSLGTYWSVKFLTQAPVALRVVFSCASVGLGGVLVNIAASTAFAPVRPWNAARLAPLMAFAKGIPLYGDPKTGILSAYIYGPIPAFVYLPTSLMHRPTSCILLGVMVSELMILAATLAVLVPASRRAGAQRRLIGPLMLAVLLAIVVRTQSLSGSIFYILSDVPAMAFVATACALLMRRRSQWALAGSALLAVLGCWSKQTTAPFVVAPLIFLLVADGCTATLAYLGWLVVWGVIVSGGLIAQFGARAMWFNMVEVPSRQHLKYADHGIIYSFGRGFLDWIIDAIWPIAPLAVASCMASLSMGCKGVRDAAWLRRVARRRPWLLLLLSGVILMPSGVLGYIKVWGTYNNFATSHFCLVLAGCAAVLDFWPGFAASRPMSANLLAVAGCIAVFFIGIDANQVGSLDAIGALLTTPSNNQEETIFNFDVSRPGLVYFPWDPLPPLLAEGKLYHFEWGFVDRIEANLPPSDPQVRMHLPSNMRFIASPATSSTCALQFLPEFRPIGESRTLPNYTLYGPVQR